LYTRYDVHDFVTKCVDIKNLVGDGKGGLLTLSVKVILNNPRQLPKDLSHSHYSALSIKNALCDVVRELRGDRFNVDVENPDVPLVAILRGNGGAASMSLYRSLHPPGSLHKRGYRQGNSIHKAAMKESMAAGLLLEAGWMEKVKAATTDQGSKHQLRFIDPMAGSGSLLLEACMMAADIAPGLMRIRCGIPNHTNPPVTRWKSSDNVNEAWKTVLLNATQRAKVGIQIMQKHRSLIQFVGNDIHSGALDMMKLSLSSAGLLNFVHLSNEDCYDLDVKTENKDVKIDYFVATNPPW